MINTGRGATINDSDLLKALDADFLSKAVLDVFRAEPLHSSSPYWEHEKVIVTPHVSGHIVTDQSIAKIFEDNYRRFCVNEPMRYLVDFEKGY